MKLIQKFLIWFLVFSVTLLNFAFAKPIEAAPPPPPTTLNIYASGATDNVNVTYEVNSSTRNCGGTNSIVRTPAHCESDLEMNNNKILANAVNDRGEPFNRWSGCDTTELAIPDAPGIERRCTVSIAKNANHTITAFYGSSSATVGSGNSSTRKCPVLVADRIDADGNPVGAQIQYLFIDQVFVKLGGTTAATTRTGGGKDPDKWNYWGANSNKTEPDSWPKGHRYGPVALDDPVKGGVTLNQDADPSTREAFSKGLGPGTFDEYGRGEGTKGELSTKHQVEHFSDEALTIPGTSDRKEMAIQPDDGSYVTLHQYPEPDHDNNVGVDKTLGKPYAPDYIWSGEVHPDIEYRVTYQRNQSGSFSAFWGGTFGRIFGDSDLFLYGEMNVQIDCSDLVIDKSDEDKSGAYQHQHAYLVDEALSKSWIKTNLKYYSNPNKAPKHYPNISGFSPTFKFRWEETSTHGGITGLILRQIMSLITSIILTTFTNILDTVTRVLNKMIIFPSDTFSEQASLDKCLLRVPDGVNPDAFCAKTNSVVEAYKFFRDTMNMLYVLVLVIIAIANILRINLEKYDIKTAIPRLVLSIALVNISILIVRGLLDVSNVLSYALVDWAATTGGSQASVTGFGIAGSSQSLAFLLNAGSGLSFFALTPLLLLLAIVAAFILLLNLVARQIAIYMLAILAPLAFFAFGVPFLRNLTNTWFKQLTKWIFMGPMILFFLVLGQFIIQAAATDTATPKWIIFVSGVAVLFIASTVPHKMAGFAIGNFGNLVKGWGKRLTGAALGAARRSPGIRGAVAKRVEKIAPKVPFGAGAALNRAAQRGYLEALAEQDKRKELSKKQASLFKTAEQARDTARDKNLDVMTRLGALEGGVSEKAFGDLVKDAEIFKDLIKSARPDQVQNVVNSMREAAKSLPELMDEVFSDDEVRIKVSPRDKQGNPEWASLSDVPEPMTSGGMATRVSAESINNLGKDSLTNDATRRQLSATAVAGLRPDKRKFLVDGTDGGKKKGTLDVVKEFAIAKKMPAFKDLTQQNLKDIFAHLDSSAVPARIQKDYKENFSKLSEEARAAILRKL